MWYIAEIQPLLVLNTMHYIEFKKIVAHTRQIKIHVPIFSKHL